MTDFLDRLEHELVDAARRDADRPIRVSRPRQTPMLLAAALIGVVALLLATGASHGGPALGAGGAPAPGSGPVARTGPANPYVSFVNCAFALRGAERELPRLVQSPGSPGRAITEHVRVLRRPQRATDRLAAADIARERLGVLETFPRYTRMLWGPGGTRVALIPARICGHHAGHRPFLALLAVAVDRPRTTVLWATSAGLGTRSRTVRLADANGWFSATILPGGRTRILAASARGRAPRVIPGRPA